MRPTPNFKLTIHYQSTKAIQTDNAPGCCRVERTMDMEFMTAEDSPLYHVAGDDNGAEHLQKIRDAAGIRHAWEQV